MSRHQLLFLGCGSSVGVPVLGCSCAVCQSKNSHNQRLRCSVFVKINEKNLLIDAGPDFRQQILTHQIRTIDGVLLTHSHHDHIGGLNDLKPFNYFAKKPIPILLSETTSKDILNRYDYLFTKDFFKLAHLPDTHGEVIFQDINVGYCTYHQAGMAVNGYRLGSLAYLTDLNEFDDSIFYQLKGVKKLIISALRFTYSDIHLTVDEAIAFSERLGAEQTWLTHLSHDLDYESANAYLPKNIRMAYDGLIINFE